MKFFLGLRTLNKENDEGAAGHVGEVAPLLGCIRLRRCLAAVLGFRAFRGLTQPDPRVGGGGCLGIWALGLQVYRKQSSPDLAWSSLKPKALDLHKPDSKPQHMNKTKIKLPLLPIA